MKTKILLLFSSIASFSAFSTEPNKTEKEQQLLSSCQTLATNSQHKDSWLCASFIRGFIAAARAIDPPVINNNNNKKPRVSGFSSRPYPKWGQYSTKRFFPFCIPDDITTTYVVKALSKELYPQYSSIRMLEKKILRELKYAYPCTTIQQN